MAKFSKAQYEILGEALGQALYEQQKKRTPLLSEIALQVAGKVADYLVLDNQNFEPKRFLSDVKAIANLYGLNLVDDNE